MKKVFILLAVSLSLGVTVNAFANDADFKAGKPVIKDVTKGSGTEMVLEILIKAKPQEVWDVLADYEKFPEFMPLEEVKVKSRSGNTEIVFVKPEAPPMIDISYTLKRTYHKDKWRLEFEKVEGKVKDINGYWQLESYKSAYTKATYVSNVDTGGAIPGFVKDYFAKGSLKKVGEGVKKRVESHGKWKR